VKAFAQLLSVLEQNSGARWEDLLGGISIVPDAGGERDKALDTAGSDDELTSLRIGS
jgi:hypothetical protein